MILFTAVSIAQKDSSTNLTNSINLSVSYGGDFNLNPNYSFQIKRHDFSIGPTLMLFPWWFTTNRTITVSGINFNYQFHPFRKQNIFDFSLQYNLIYQHYYHDHEIESVSYNSFQNHLGFNNRIKLMKNYYVDLSMGIGNYYYQCNFHDFVTNKKSSRDYSHLSGIIKFGIGYNFN